MLRSGLGIVALLAAAVGLGGRGAAADPPGPQVSYYLGESKMTMPDGKLLRTSLTLVKRVVNQKESRIEEHVLSVTDKESRPFVTVLQVKDSKFTVSEKSKAFTGDGELVGEAWKWTGWKSVSKLANGAGTVTSEDKLTDQGLEAKKTFAGADGKVSLHFEEKLLPISQKTYEILSARLAPVEKK
jgi:hypothetical protein